MEEVNKPMKNIKFFVTSLFLFALFGAVSIFGQNRVEPIPMTSATPANKTITTSATPTSTPNGKLVVNPVPQVNGETSKDGTVNSCPTVPKSKRVSTPCSVKPAKSKPGCDICGGLGKLDKNEKDILKAINDGNDQNHKDHVETVGLLNRLVTAVESLGTSVVAIPDKIATAAGIVEVSSWLKWIFWAVVIGFLLVLFFLYWRSGHLAGHLAAINHGINGDGTDNNPGLNNRFQNLHTVVNTEHLAQQAHRERTEAYQQRMANYFANNPLIRRPADEQPEVEPETPQGANDNPTT